MYLLHCFIIINNSQVLSYLLSCVILPLPPFPRLFSLPTLHGVLPHVQRSLLAVQLEIQTTGVTHGGPRQVPPPQAGASCRAVGAPGVRTNYQLPRLEIIRDYISIWILGYIILLTIFGQ